MMAAGLAGYVGWLLWGTGVETARAQEELARSSGRLRAPHTAHRERALPAGGGVRRDRHPLDRHRLHRRRGHRLRQPEEGAGPLPASADPWDGTGQVAIAGHRTTYLHPFLNLDRSTSATGSTCSRSTGLIGTRWIAVRPAGGGVGAAIVDTVRPTLVLTTCHPKYSSRERLIVTATLVEGPEKRRGQSSLGRRREEHLLDEILDRPVQPLFLRLPDLVAIHELVDLLLEVVELLDRLLRVAFRVLLERLLEALLDLLGGALRDRASAAPPPRGPAGRPPPRQGGPRAAGSETARATRRRRWRGRRRGARRGARRPRGPRWDRRRRTARTRARRGARARRRRSAGEQTGGETGAGRPFAASRGSAPGGVAAAAGAAGGHRERTGRVDRRHGRRPVLQRGRHVHDALVSRRGILLHRAQDHVLETGGTDGSSEEGGIGASWTC